MKKSAIDKILSQVEAPIEDPLFYTQVFAYLSKIRKAKTDDPLKNIVSEEYGRLSRMLEESSIQESCSVRNILKTREIANFLIDDEGVLNTSLIAPLIQNLKKHIYSLGEKRQYDAKRNEHLIQVLQHLQNNKAIERQLRLITRPSQHRYAEEVIRDTLNLPPKTVITDAHTRKATLSAWLCYLRQNVGSCFATAPAILIQTEQPSVFLKDIQELLSTGRLKRTFGGIEYAVPLSFSWGAGDLRRVFVFQKEVSDDHHPIWRSPGLIAAFEQVGIIREDFSINEKIKESKRLIIQVLNKLESRGSWIITSLENILRQALLLHLELTEQELADYEQRPKGMILGGLMITTQGSGKDRGGLEKKCSAFFENLKVAKDVFKMFADNALLKTWEFTLASFSETKLQFTTWNLYSSLGLRMEDKGGIGPKLYEILKRRLDECNEKVSSLQVEYEQSYAQLQFVQNRLRRASSEEEARWLKIEYQAKSSTFNSIEEMRNTFHNKARRYANLYNGLIDLYFTLFPNYFQEVYDPDILEVAMGPYDDSPAGFRLVYKHGRANTSQWTPIRNSTEFIESLASFFTATETELVNAPEMKGLEDDIAEIVTSIVSHVRSKEFIETAFWRMAKAHGGPLIKDPLENLDKIEKKPWVYTSGGALTTLVSCYFRLDDKPTEVSRWVESPIELAVFLIDAVKGLPDKIQREFKQNSEKSLLIHSPTHAFLLKPGYDLFTTAWSSKEFTYTWARDNIVRPREYFVDMIYLDSERMQFLTENLALLVPKNFQHYFRQTFANLGGSMKASDYRQHLLDTMDLTIGLQYSGRTVLTADQIDSALYSWLPLFPSYKLKERIEIILQKLPGITDSEKKQILEIFENISGKFGTQKTLTAEGLQNIIKALIALVTFKTSAEFDYPLLISRVAQEEGFAMPKPFIFADTNWVKEHFAFVVNPGSGKFELWRLDYTGSSGAPMSDWRKWMDGSQKEPNWGVYVRPHEYTLSD